MAIDRVAVRSPQGAVRVVTRQAFEAVHRPHGFQIIETGVDPNRAVWFLSESPAPNTTGGGRLRSEWPAAALLQTGWYAKSTVGWPGGLNEGDTVVMHRMLAPEWYPWPIPGVIADYQRAGVRVLVDRDDELERIPKQNEKRATRWQLEEHRAQIAAADGLIVTTRRLEEVYGPLARATWRCPNYLPGWVSDITSDLPPGDRVRVGWAGLITTHRQDIEWLAPSAPKACRGAQFVIVGDDRVPGILGLTEAIAEPPQFDIRTYYAMAARADVGLVPLDNAGNREFNTAKSDLKTKEWLALGKPVVATDLPEQRAVLDGTGAGFLARTPDEFAEMTQELVGDHRLRAEMTAAARSLALTLRLERNVECWARPLREVAEQQAA